MASISSGVGSTRAALNLCSADHGQRPAIFFDFFPATAQFADGVGGKDVDFLFAELGFAPFYFLLELAAFDQEPLKNFFFGNIGDAFALHIDDAFAVAGEDGDVGAI